MSRFRHFLADVARFSKIVTATQRGNGGGTLSPGRAPTIVNQLMRLKSELSRMALHNSAFLATETKINYGYSQRSLNPETSIIVKAATHLTRAVYMAYAVCTQPKGIAQRQRELVAWRSNVGSVPSGIALA
ncbi:hypothetical protein Trydic_g2871 [Trypoxylus dichotomus]